LSAYAYQKALPLVPAIVDTLERAARGERVRRDLACLAIEAATALFALLRDWTAAASARLQ